MYLSQQSPDNTSAAVYGYMSVSLAIIYHTCTVLHLLSIHNTHYDAGGPRVEKEEGTDQKGAGEHDTDGQQEPVAQTNILFPEQERVAVGVGG